MSCQSCFVLFSDNNIPLVVCKHGHSFCLACWDKERCLCGVRSLKRPILNRDLLEQAIDIRQRFTHADHHTLLQRFTTVISEATDRKFVHTQISSIYCTLLQSPFQIEVPPCLLYLFHPHILPVVDVLNNDSAKVLVSPTQITASFAANVWNPHNLLSILNALCFLLRFLHGHKVLTNSESSNNVLHISSDAIVFKSHHPLLDPFMVLNDLSSYDVVDNPLIDLSGLLQSGVATCLPNETFVRLNHILSSTPIPLFDLISKLSSLQCITSMSAGSWHSLYINNNRLYGCGRNTFGALGFDTSGIRSEEIPIVMIDDNDHVTDVVCGGSHSLVLTWKKKVYVTGKNNFGQLGLNHCRDCSSFVPIHLSDYSITDEVISIAAGDCHSFLITSGGHVFGFGNNSNGQIGGGGNVTIITIPKQISFPEPIQAVKCGVNHSLFLSIIGNVYVTGSNEYGQIMRGSRLSVFHPRKLDLSFPVSSVACGAVHSLVLSASKELYGFGRGFQNNNSTDNQSPIKIDSSVDCFDGGQSFTVYIKEKRVHFNKYMMRSDDEDMHSCVHKPQKLKALGHSVSVVAGNEHFIVHSDDKKIKGFGNNQFFQCNVGVSV
ncbi:hypothetical protein GEMRC1_008093 [Eukaryota sp. GEM-RC1]